MSFKSNTTAEPPSLATDCNQVTSTSMTLVTKSNSENTTGMAMVVTDWNSDAATGELTYFMWSSPLSAPPTTRTMFSLFDSSDSPRVHLSHVKENKVFRRNELCIDVNIAKDSSHVNMGVDELRNSKCTRKRRSQSLLPDQINFKLRSDVTQLGTGLYIRHPQWVANNVPSINYNSNVKVDTLLCKNNRLDFVQVINTGTYDNDFGNTSLISRNDESNEYSESVITNKRIPAVVEGGSALLVQGTYSSKRPASPVTPTTPIISFKLPGDQNSLPRTPANICRICHEVSGALISPCLCSGTVGLIHKRCLERWLTTTSTASCEICRHAYAVVQRTPPCYRLFLDKDHKDLRRAVVVDLLCFMWITTLAVAATCMCVLGAIESGQKFHNASTGMARGVSTDLAAHQWETGWLVLLATVLLFGYLLWFVIAIRAHLKIWSTWKSLNQRVKLVDIQRWPSVPTAPPSSPSTEQHLTPQWVDHGAVSDSQHHTSSSVCSHQRETRYTQLLPQQSSSSVHVQDSTNVLSDQVTSVASPVLEVPQSPQPVNFLTNKSTEDSVGEGKFDQISTCSQTSNNVNGGSASGAHNLYDTQFCHSYNSENYCYDNTDSQTSLMRCHSVVGLSSEGSSFERLSFTDCSTTRSSFLSEPNSIVGSPIPIRPFQTKNSPLRSYSEPRFSVKRYPVGQSTPNLRYPIIKDTISVSSDSRCTAKYPWISNSPNILRSTSYSIYSSNPKFLALMSTPVSRSPLPSVTRARLLAARSLSPLLPVDSGNDDLCYKSYLHSTEHSRSNTDKLSSAVANLNLRIDSSCIESNIMSNAQGTSNRTNTSINANAYEYNVYSSRNSHKMKRIGKIPISVGVASILPDGNVFSNNDVPNVISHGLTEHTCTYPSYASNQSIMETYV